MRQNPRHDQNKEQKFTKQLCLKSLGILTVFALQQVILCSKEF